MIKGDLISREALKEAYKDFDIVCQHESSYDYYIGVLELIDNAQPVELEELDKLSKITEITARALRSEDPINLYKARALAEIAEILGIELEAPAEESDSKDQITFDDII